MISSKSTKAIAKAVYQYYYGDISAVEKGERVRIQFYTKHWMFSSKYLTIVAKIQAVVVTTRADGDHRRWRRWFYKDGDKLFIS